jgi:hypothetical protein
MAKYKYAGMTLTDLKKSKGGLMKNLLQAKVQATAILHEKLELEEEPIVEEYQEVEAKLMRNAIIGFLTSEDLNWTIAEMKASVELEEISTVAPFATKVDTAVNTTVAAGIPTQGFSAGATTGPGTGTGTGKGMVTEPLMMMKGGAKHGGPMKAVGHAYIGDPDIVPNSDTTDDENEFTRVRLYYDKIKSELL